MPSDYRETLDRVIFAEPYGRLSSVADAIREVLAEVERLRVERDDAIEMHTTCHRERDEARAEVERLKEEVRFAESRAQALGEMFREAGCFDPSDLVAEVERLKAALDDIRNHVCLPSEPSAISMRKLADKALKGGIRGFARDMERRLAEVAGEEKGSGGRRGPSPGASQEPTVAGDAPNVTLRTRNAVVNRNKED